jgi:hypothetical protein
MPIKTDYVNAALNADMLFALALAARDAETFDLPADDS